MGKVGTSRHILEKVGTWEKQAQVGTVQKSRHMVKVGTSRHILEKVGTWEKQAQVDTVQKSRHMVKVGAFYRKQAYSKSRYIRAGIFHHLGFAYLPFCSLCMQNLNKARKKRAAAVALLLLLLLLSLLLLLIM